MPYGHYGPPMHRGGFKPHFGPGGGRMMMDSKRDKFPNYLHHVPPEEDPLSTRTLFAGNLELNISEEELRRIFSRYGTVDDIDIKRPPPGTGNAYAFVRYQNLDMAHRAKIELSGQYIGKFQCKIGYGKVMPTTRVWVGGLGPWVSLTQLTQEFDRFGAIKKIEYEKGDNQAYILYESMDAAQAAVKEMRGVALGGPDKKLRTDFAEVSPPPGTYPTPGTSSGNGTPAEYPREEWNGRAGYEEYGEYSGGFIRGRGRGRGMWHDRGRGGHRGNYHGDFRGPDYYEGHSEGADGAETHSESGSSLSNARTLADVARKTSASWTGSLILKNSAFGTKMHTLEGLSDLSELLQDDNNRPLLRITQRLRLDQSRLDDVSRRINAPSTATILLSLPNTTAPPLPDDASVQTRPLRNLVAYLKQKEAAGVITLAGRDGGSGSSAVGSVLYAFPPCVFSLDLLRRAAPNLTEETTRDDHLVVVVVRGTAA
ncbi:Spen SPOC C-terminal [Trinorchestia longiramus]|nr:Spen SPOC C-terminal [Trinorchestia longiramus]